ncbi:hypothetical protein ACWDGI_13670 [Streptomyces sp. NPDC001220]
MTVTVDIGSAHKRSGLPGPEVLKRRTRTGFVFQDVRLVDEPTP